MRAARLALVIHFVRWAANDAALESPDAVDAASMKAGIELAQWFKAEARRVYALLGESDDDREQRRLIEWIERKGGSATARELMRSSRQWATANDAEAVLDDLAAANYGRWMEQPTSSKGGRPTRVFVLADNADVDTTHTKPSENDSCVNVNSVNGPDDEWEGSPDEADEADDEADELIESTDLVDGPTKPCPKCGSWEQWQTAAGDLFGRTPGNWRCEKCDPSTDSDKLKERAARLKTGRSIRK